MTMHTVKHYTATCRSKEQFGEAIDLTSERNNPPVAETLLCQQRSDLHQDACTADQRDPLASTQVVASPG